MRLSQRLILLYVRTKFKLLSTISKRKAAEKAFNLFLTPQSRSKRELPAIFKTAEKLEFPFEGDVVRGFRWNHPSSRKALILHGFESSVVNFDLYIKPLIEKGYEVLAFDAPAHGISSGKMINVLIYTNMIVHICRKYGPVQAFITHSFGGLALSLALEEIPHDEKVKAVLIAPATETRRAIDNYFRLLKLDSGVRNEFEKMISEIGGKPSSWYSISRAAGNIHAQVLFLQDKNDNTTPLGDVEPIMGKNYPNFQFVLSDGLGHRKIYRDPDSVNRIMEFL